MVLRRFYVDFYGRNKLNFSRIAPVHSRSGPSVGEHGRGTRYEKKVKNTNTFAVRPSGETDKIYRAFAAVCTLNRCYSVV